MKKGKYFGITVAFILVTSLVVAMVAGACAPAAPEEEVAELEEEIADLEDEVAAKDREITGLEGDVGDLEDEIAALKKPAEVFKWRWQSHQPPTDPEYAVTVVNVAKRVEEMSDGRLTFELFTGGALVPSNEVLPSCADGVFEVGSSAASYWKGTAPECLVTLFPMGYRNGDEQASVTYNYGLLDFFRDSYADMGVHLLTMVQHGNINLLSKAPIREVGDFEGVLIRTHGSTAILVEELGASTVYIPGEEIYMALQLGTVDAMTWGGPSTLYLNKWYEQAEYILLDPPLIGNFMNDDFYVNMAAWESLPAELSAILQYAADLAFFENGVTFRKGDDEAIIMLKAEGIEFTTLSEADKAVMTKAAEVVWDDIASKSPRAKEAVKIITDLLRDKGYTDYKIE